MRHNRKVNHLGKTSSHRKAMLANMATSLIMHKRIKTTVAKAKALRIYVEPLLTKSKEDSTHSRRMVFGYLQNKDAVTELFREISPKIAERPGGYTRILKIGNRVGDSAEMCYIELVDYNENMLGAKAEAGAKTGKRRRRGSGKKKEEAETPVTKKSTKKTEEVTEEPVEEVESVEQEAVETETVSEPDTAVENVTDEKSEAAGQAETGAEQKENSEEEEKKE